MWKPNMKSLSNGTLNFFFRKFWVSYILDLAKTVKYLRMLSQKSTRNFGIEGALSTGEPGTCEYVTLLQSFHRSTLSIHWYIAQTFSLPFPCPSYVDALLRLLSLALWKILWFSFHRILFSQLIQWWFKSRLFGLHVLFAFFRK